MKRLVDLCCCEGGASMGFSRSGFAVVGVDKFEKYSQKRYPFPSYKFDGLDVLRWLIRGAPLPIGGELLSLDDIAAFAASPPCWKFSKATPASHRDRHEDLIDDFRQLLIETGKPYVIENVEEAPLRRDLLLCGTMFGLGAIDTDGATLELRRHRVFESNVPLVAPSACRHGDVGEHVAGVYDGARDEKYAARNIRKGGYVPRSKAVAEQLMGIDWMSWDGLYQALPPAYTEHIGNMLLAHTEEAA